MSLTVTASFSPNDAADAPQALLQGGPFHNSVIEINDKKTPSVTVTSGDTTATYLNTEAPARDGKLIFFYSRNSTRKG